VGSRLVSVEVRGFRAFGTEARQFDLDVPLAVVHAGNSQGKTSFAEALEFLFSGRSSRRDLLGGAKAEYHDSLRNAHMPGGDDGVYVEAVVRVEDGTTRRVRRELVCDFGPGVECDSRLFIDGIATLDLAPIGIPLADPPVRAPVLLQHILRHALSTEPKQRVGYFKALLSLTDLDLLREHVAAARADVERVPVGSSLTAVGGLAATPAAAAGATLKALADRTLDAKEAASAVDVALLDAGAAVLGSKSSDLERLVQAVKQEAAAQRESAFPLAAFALGGSTPAAPAPVEAESYETFLSDADQAAARLAPVLSAVLSVEEYGSLEHPVDCPVCGTASALTPERLTALRDQLHLTRAVDTAAGATAAAISDTRHELDVLGADVRRVVPLVAAWGDEQIAKANAQLLTFGVDEGLASAALKSAQLVAGAATSVQTMDAQLRGHLDRMTEAISGRQHLPEAGLVYANLHSALDQLDVSGTTHAACSAELRAAVEPVLRHRIATSGLLELDGLLDRREELVDDLLSEASRRRAVQRLKAAERALREASGRVLDDRFARMSDAISAWWTSIRPEELVGFGGVKRRAGGERFVNLVAALRADPAGPAVERDALGVYSDSQLNALGLSIFLARTELLGASIVVLDDPIPGSDSDHRLTFVQNTLSRLLDAGFQVILTTFDSKLADWAQSNHDWRGLVAYELTLHDVVVGTDITQTSDMFSRLLLDAEDNLNAPSARGDAPPAAAIARPPNALQSRLSRPVGRPTASQPASATSKRKQRFSATSCPSSADTR
jgi:AAA domain